MTPNGVIPSMHDAITGHWKPNSIDIDQWIKYGFGVTINILNGREECRNSLSLSANRRGKFYRKIMKALGLIVPDNEEINCIG